MDDAYYFNGLNARSGGYTEAPKTADELVALAMGEDPLEASEANALKKRANKDEKHFGVIEGVDPDDLSEAGWGAVFPRVEAGSEAAQRQAAIREALRPLFDLRRSQAAAKNARFFRELVDAEGYAAGMGKRHFLKQHKTGASAANPENLPYYLMLVGAPDEIPFGFQSQLSVQYAVGRLDLETVEDYARYAQSVVEAETGQIGFGKTMGFFGVANKDDGSTQSSEADLIQPLSAWAAEREGWAVDLVAREAATKARLGAMFGGAETPALLFTASHGIGFPVDDPVQREHQGALVCQDWPGPKDWKAEIGEDFYFGGHDLSADARLHGLVTFNFACFGGGTPQRNEFRRSRPELTRTPFVARLPQRALGHANGGALASINHVGQAWSLGYQMMPDRRTRISELDTFTSTLGAMLAGKTVGHSMSYFHDRYAVLATELTELLEQVDMQMKVSPRVVANHWIAHNDARSYAILGDPAVRIATGEGQAAPMSIPEISSDPAPTEAPDVDSVEAAVIRVLAGEAASAVAGAVGLEAGDLSAKAEAYRAAGRATLA